jgi:hypothetical protein
MGIPDRLWRVVKGHWDLASEKIGDAQNRADAYEELAEALKEAPPVRAEQSSTGAPVLPTAPASTVPGQYDPLDAAYVLLKLAPGADLTALDAAREARLEEIHPEYYAEGSADRAAQDARKKAIEIAYAKLRDALNPVETRFERLEF